LLRSSLSDKFFPFSLTSTTDWQYAANEFVKQLPDDVIVHCKLLDFVFLPTTVSSLLLIFLLYYPFFSNHPSDSFFID
jgi:hypothetical protein